MRHRCTCSPFVRYNAGESSFPNLDSFCKNKIHHIDPVVIRIPNKREPVNLMRREGLKSLECIIDGLFGVLRAHHGYCDGAVRWVGGWGGGQHLSQCLEFLSWSWMFIMGLEIVCPGKVVTMQKE